MSSPAQVENLKIIKIVKETCMTCPDMTWNRKIKKVVLVDSPKWLSHITHIIVIAMKLRFSGHLGLALRRGATYASSKAEIINLFAHSGLDNNYENAWDFGKIFLRIKKKAFCQRWFRSWIRSVLIKPLRQHIYVNLFIFTSWSMVHIWMNKPIFSSTILWWVEISSSADFTICRRFAGPCCLVSLIVTWIPDTASTAVIFIKSPW